MAKIPHRLYLTEDQMPKQWYNLRADMKEKPAPLIHPGTHQPLPEEARPSGAGRENALYRHSGADPRYV